ncbi:MAG TPA: F0F1 ATP synthase subunit alpha, partial [Gemmatirosa sp.]|nr:F0F1 ATP synthase subunit alpha [Gemmatirosa sp.]
DQATRRQLDRGARTVEILKQPQYSPLSVAEQVMVIYAVTNGYLDTVPVSRVREWERGFLDYSRAQYPQVGDSITKTKALGKDVEPDLKRAIDAFNQLFGAGK